VRKVLALTVFPLIGIALLAAAGIWSSREIRLRMTGVPVAGQISGMVLERGNSAELLAGMDTTLILRAADGATTEVKAKDGGITGIRSTQANGNESTTLAIEDLSPDLQRVVEDTVGGSGEIVRWALLRESRRPDAADRIVRIERTDTVHGFFGLESAPEIPALRDGRPHVEGATPGTVTIRAVFDRSDAEALAARKGDALAEYGYLRNGEPVTPERRDFYLAAEPYETQFRPVFVYEVKGTRYSRLSHIGRHGGPTLALRLYNPCRVYYDPARPSDALLMPEPGALSGDPLAWFSRYCEGLFGQWGGTALMVLAAVTCLVVGLLFLSLAVRPGIVIKPTNE